MKKNLVTVSSGEEKLPFAIFKVVCNGMKMNLILLLSLDITFVERIRKYEYSSTLLLYISSFSVHWPK